MYIISLYQCLTWKINIRDDLMEHPVFAFASLSNLNITYINKQRTFHNLTYLFSNFQHNLSAYYRYKYIIFLCG